MIDHQHDDPHPGEQDTVLGRDTSLQTPFIDKKLNEGSSGHDYDAPGHFPQEVARHKDRQRGKNQAVHNIDGNSLSVCDRVSMNACQGISPYISQVINDLIALNEEEKKDSRKNHRPPGDTWGEAIGDLAPMLGGQGIAENGNHKPRS